VRVRMLMSVSGTVDGLNLPPRGSEVDLPDHVAADLCKSGHAVPVTSEAEAETASADVVDVETRAGATTTSRAQKSAREGHEGVR